MFKISVAWLSFGLLLSTLVACTPAAKPSVEQSVKTEQDKALTAVIVDDLGLGEAIPRRWASEGNGTFKVINVTEDEFRSAKFVLQPEVDVVVFTNRLFGDLIAEGQLLEIDETTGSLGINRENILSHYRENLTRYGNQTMALPVGAPQLALFYRTDLLPEKPPQTWAELTAFLPSGDGEVAGFLEPLSGPWAAHSLLARVAPAIRFRGRISTVFDLETMEPLISSEPFVRALSEMVEQHRKLQTKEFLSPKEAFERLVAGKAKMAITWPQPSDTGDSPKLDIAVTRLLTTSEWYDAAQEKWVKRDENMQRNIDYLGSDGRLVGIAKNTLRANEAIAFAVWLSSNQVSQKLMPESQASGPFRLSHLASVGLWTKGSIPDSAVDLYADLTRQVHEGEMCLTFPRVSRQSEYLDALANAVRAAIEGRLPPTDALAEAANEWQKITESVGFEKQKDILRRTEGLLTSKFVD
ncbi:MAG: extracellular solute-binding protein [Pirellulaceae bacterium]